jgi:phage major head subunit gpT-like protein
MLVTQGNVAAIFKGYGTKFWEAFAASAEPLSNRIAMQVPSTGLSEEHNWLSATAGIRKLVDEATINPMRAQNYAIVNEEFEETLSLKEIEVRADKFGLLTPRLAILGANAKYYPDIMLSDLLVKSFDGSEKDYMGGQFFDANKKAYAEAEAFSNVTTGRLTAARFREARANLRKRVNHKGRPLGLGRELTLVVGPDDEHTAREILFAETIGNNTNVDRGTAKLEVWPQLSATAGLERAWFLFDFGSPFKPFIHQELSPWTYYTVDDPRAEYVLRHHEFLYQIYRAGAMGFGFPECAYGSDGTVV